MIGTLLPRIVLCAPSADQPVELRREGFKSITKPLAAAVTVGAVVMTAVSLTSSGSAQPAERPAPGMAHFVGGLGTPTPWAVDEDGVGDFTVTPESFATEVGVRQDVVFVWTGLEGPLPAGVEAVSPDVRRCLGRATYRDGEDVVATTLLRVDVGGGGNRRRLRRPRRRPRSRRRNLRAAHAGAVDHADGDRGGDAGLYAGLDVGALLIGGLPRGHGRPPPEHDG